MKQISLMKTASFLLLIMAKPENFARYGSAKKYYGDAIRNIYKTYPYDGSLYERLDWQNSSSYVAIYMF